METTADFIKIVATGLSQQSGIKIEAGNQWATDGKTLVYDEGALTKISFEAVRGFLLHEVGHLLFTTKCATSENDKKYQNHAQAIYNAYEDVAIEQKLKDKFGDYGEQALKESTLNCIEGFFQQGTDFRKMPKWAQFIWLVHFIEVSSDEPFMSYFGYRGSYALEGFSYFPRHLELIFSAEVMDRVRANKHKIDEFLDYLRYRNPTTQEAKDKTDEVIFPLIKDFLEQDKANQQPQQQQASGGKKKQKANSKQQQEAPRHSFKVGKKDGEKMKMVRLSEKEAKALFKPYINTLATKLAQILKEREATRYTGHHKRGKLLGKNAYKVVIKDEPRIFSRKNNPNKPKYNVFLGLDASGSMLGKRADACFLAGAVLSGACEKLGFNLRIFAFNHDVEELNGLEEYTDIGGGTNEEELVRILADEVKSDDENLIFILTDCELTFDSSRKTSLERIKRKGGQLFGIGIGSRQERLARAYPHAVAVQDLAKLPRLVINLLQRSIHR